MTARNCRLGYLNADSRGEWGKMTVDQMLWRLLPGSNNH